MFPSTDSPKNAVDMFPRTDTLKWHSFYPLKPCGMYNIVVKKIKVFKIKIGWCINTSPTKLSFPIHVVNIVFLKLI